MTHTGLPFVISSSAFSAFFSFLTIFCFVKFPVLRSKLLARVIFWMAFCTFIASVMVAIGYPRNHSLCAMQGSLSYFFLRGSWSWALMLCYQLRTLIMHDKMYLLEYQMHLLVWGINLVIELLPLHWFSYGTDDELYGKASCGFAYGGKDKLGSFWNFISFRGFLICSFSVMIFMCIRIQWSLRDANLVGAQTNKKRTANAMILYPLSMILLWLPLMIYSTLTDLNALSYSVVAGEAVFSLAMLYGIPFAVLFIAKSPEVRRLWCQFLSQFLPGASVSCCSKLFSPKPDTGSLSTAAPSPNHERTLNNRMSTFGDPDAEDEFEHAVRETEAEHYRYISNSTASITSIFSSSNNRRESTLRSISHTGQELNTVQSSALAAVGEGGRNSAHNNIATLNPIAEEHA